MCGLPFSGKTVLAEKLAVRFGFSIVSIDDIRDLRGFSWQENEKVTPEDWTNIFNESFKKTLAFLRSGKSVIYDSANQDKFSRDRLKRVAAKGNFPTRVIFMDIPESVCRERWLKNKKSKKRTRFDLPDNLFQAAADTFEVPEEDEDIITYSRGTDLESWIQSNFQIKNS